MFDPFSFKRAGGWEVMPPWQIARRILGLSALAAVVGAVPIVALYNVHHLEQILLVLFYTFVCAVIMGGLIGSTLIRFGRRMYLLPFPLNWMLLCAAILACTFVGSLAANAVFFAVGEPPQHDFLASLRLINEFAAVCALIFGLSSFVYEMLRTTVAGWQLLEETARKRALEAQLASLESHIRPHFLFNSLNTISSLIADDPKQAEALTGKLASLLRVSLDAPRNGMTTLGSELKMVRDYLEIETARFGSRVRYRIDVAPGCEGVAVPTFCLQTLVENSVKYAVAPRQEGGCIHIGAKVGASAIDLEVTDDGPGFTADAIQPGHGLGNLRERLSVLYGDSAKMEIGTREHRTSVSLHLPLCPIA